MQGPGEQPYHAWPYSARASRLAIPWPGAWQEGAQTALSELKHFELNCLGLALGRTSGDQPTGSMPRQSNPTTGTKPVSSAARQHQETLTRGLPTLQRSLGLAKAGAAGRAGRGVAHRAAPWARASARRLLLPTHRLDARLPLYLRHLQPVLSKSLGLPMPTQLPKWQAASEFSRHRTDSPPSIASQPARPRAHRCRAASHSSPPAHLGTPPACCPAAP